MAKLAKDDPEAFERKRQALIHKVIDQSSPHLQGRMQGLQWQIDQVRDSSTNPMGACIRISKMMWDSVLEDDGLLNRLESLQSGNHIDSSQESHSADIIPFNQQEND